MTAIAAIMLAAATTHVKSPYLSAAAANAADGRIIMAENADAECYPASCTKLMTLLLALEAVEKGAISLDDIVPTTPLSERERPSRIDFTPPSGMSLDDLLKALMVKSANNGAVTIAEHVASRLHPEATNGVARLQAFVGDMNRRAKSLGMKRTLFTSPNGYPPEPGSRRKFDTSTACDMIRLGCEVVKHPAALRYTSLEFCNVKEKPSGKPHVYRTHNKLLLSSSKYKLAGVDGLKTGFHNAGGCSIVLTATNSVGRRAIVAVMGSPSGADRDSAAYKFMVDSLKSLEF